MNGIIEEQVKEIKHNLCVNCGDRCCCHGMESCKDANEYIAKGSEVKCQNTVTFTTLQHTEIIIGEANLPQKKLPVMLMIIGANFSIQKQMV